jgi:hypothetical protein
MSNDMIREDHEPGRLTRLLHAGRLHRGSVKISIPRGVYWSESTQEV